MFQMLFSTEGRAGRSTWWLGQLCCMCLCVFALTVVSAGGASGASLGLAALALLGSLWINVCVTIKRYHDLDKSGAWFAIVFIPLIGPVWQMVECGFVTGSFDSNTYGPPPSAGGRFGDSGADQPGALANKEIDFSKYRLSQPNILPTPAGASVARAAPAKPIFGKRA